jgi:hypothetical protein
MTEFILELYAAICAFATIAYVALGLASSKRLNSDELDWLLEPGEDNRSAHSRATVKGAGKRDR